MRWCSACALGTVLLACGGGTTENKGSGNGGEPAANGSDPCAAKSQSVGWQDSTPLGVTPQQAFAPLSVACSTPFMWDGSVVSTIDVMPRSGMTDVTVTVAVDKKSARVGSTIDPLQCAKVSLAPRPSEWLEVDAHVKVATANGSLSAEGDTTALYDTQVGLSSIKFDEPASKVEGTLQILPRDPNMPVQLHFGEDVAHCTGDIAVDMPPPSDPLVPHNGQFASWSHTGCFSALDPVSLDTSWWPGDTLRALLTRAWSKATYTGSWDDGSSTNLTLSADQPPDAGCLGLAGDTLSFATNVTYGSSDGRVKVHTAPANVVISKQGGVPVPSLSTYESYSCDATGSATPYIPASCGELSRVVVQFGVSYGNITGMPMGGSLIVTEFGKDASPDATIPDKMAELSFSPAP